MSKLLCALGLGRFGPRVKSEEQTAKENEKNVDVACNFRLYASFDYSTIVTRSSIFVVFVMTRVHIKYCGR
jgi:hypothetical protein